MFCFYCHTTVIPAFTWISEDLSSGYLMYLYILKGDQGKILSFIVYLEAVPYAHSAIPTTGLAMIVLGTAFGRHVAASSVF